MKPACALGGLTLLLANGIQVDAKSCRHKSLSMGGYGGNIKAKAPDSSPQPAPSKAGATDFRAASVEETGSDSGSNSTTLSGSSISTTSITQATSLHTSLQTLETTPAPIASAQSSSSTATATSSKPFAAQKQVVAQSNEPATSVESTASIAKSVQQGVATLVTGGTNPLDLVQQPIDDSPDMVSNYMSMYDDVGTGSCDTQLTKDLPGVALSCKIMSSAHKDSTGSIFCGATITIRPQSGPNSGSTVTAKVVDSCPACDTQPVGHIDLHSELFATSAGYTAGLGHGRGTWSFDDPAMGEMYRKFAKRVMNGEGECGVWAYWQNG